MENKKGRRERAENTGKTEKGRELEKITWGKSERTKQLGNKKNVK